MSLTYKILCINMELAVTQYSKREIWQKYNMEDNGVHGEKVQHCHHETIIYSLLFNVFMNTCIRNACSDVGDINLGFLFFVSWKIKWFTMNVRLYDATGSMELKFNISNTKGITFKKNETNDYRLYINDGQKIKQLKVFVYLEFIEDGKVDEWITKCKYK